MAEATSISLSGGVIEQRPHPFGQRLHAQDHAAHIGVFENGHGFLIPRACARGLDALGSVIGRLLRRALADLDALIADIDARIVHHREHRREPAIFGTHQLAHAFAIVAIAHDAGGRGVDAELVLDADAAQIIAAAERSIWFHVELRHDEQRYAAAAFGRVGRSCQDEVDDILRQLVLAPGNVNLLALDRPFPGVLAVLDRMGGGPQSADIGARLRLGQVHGAGPCPADQLRKILLLQLARPVMLQRLDRADAQHRKQIEGHIRRAEIFEHVAGEREGQALTAEFAG